MLSSSLSKLIILCFFRTHAFLISEDNDIFLLKYKMGCTEAKFENEKFKESAIIEDSGAKIQTIFKLDNSDVKSRRTSKGSGKDSKNKKYRNSKNNRNCGNQGRNTKIRVRSSERTSKTVYNARITAKYHIKAVIGKGTFSRVLRVEHRVSRQPYALKIIDAPGGREVFEAELSVLRRVNHPNVIKLIEVFEADDKVYMVMELATGGNLLDRLELRGSLSEDDAQCVMRMVISGVKYLHALGITHRDLKPDNLLYYHPGKDSKIMITDFGFANTRKPSGNPFMHTVCGTPQYIAPEIVARKPYTCAVDMWAVGVITYIILSGCFPFDGEHDSQIFKLILKGKVNMSDSIWNEFSNEAKAFIKHLLQPNPEMRLTAAQAAQHDWLTSQTLTYCSPKPSAKQRVQSHKEYSQKSTKSGSSRSSSSRSRRSVSSLRSGHRRVQAHHLDALSSDPEVACMIQPQFL